MDLHACYRDSFIFCCVVFIVCNVSLIVCVALCVAIYWAWCVILCCMRIFVCCTYYSITGTGWSPVAVQLNINNCNNMALKPCLISPSLWFTSRPVHCVPLSNGVLVLVCRWTSCVGCVENQQPGSTSEPSRVRGVRWVEALTWPRLVEARYLKHHGNIWEHWCEVAWLGNCVISRIVAGSIPDKVDSLIYLTLTATLCPWGLLCL
jgi:hypothetical protein